MPGLFVGYHLLPGGIWSGDYIVAELEPLLHNIDEAPYPQGKVRVHRIKEVCEYLDQPTYPLSIKREKSASISKTLAKRSVIRGTFPTMIRSQSTSITAP